MSSATTRSSPSSSTTRVPDTRERTPLLQHQQHTPGRVSERHRLGPPSIRFPGHSNTGKLERQDSYGFPKSPNEQDVEAEAGRGTMDERQDLGLRRGDSKVYTSFPRPANSPWDGPSTPPNDGLPRISRECLISEIKCYGKYMLPAFLVFVVLALTIALSIFYKYKN